MEDKEKRERNKNSVKEYQKNRDAIMLRPSKEDGATIREAARVAGQSVQAYVLQAVRERMERERVNAPGGFGISDSAGE